MSETKPQQISEVASESISLNCEFMGFGAQAQPEISVGEKLKVECQLPEGFVAPDPILILGGENDPYLLKVLEVNSISPKLDLTVTSYRVGDHSQVALRIPSEKSVVLNGLHFKTISVIDPKNPPPGPFGAIGPLELLLPAAYWWALGLSIFAVIFISIFSIYRKEKLKKMILGLKRFESHQTPYIEAQAKLRKIQRENKFFQTGTLTIEEAREIVLQLEETLKLYLTRYYLVPAFDWSQQKVFRYLRKQKTNNFNQIKEDLSLLTRELEKAKRAKNISPTDIEQLQRNLRKFLDRSQTAPVGGVK